MRALKIGFRRSALHAGCASAVARVIEAHGYDVVYVDLNEDEVQQALHLKEIDIFTSAWMPKDEALLNEGYIAVGDLYQPTVSLLSAGNLVRSENYATESDVIMISQTVATIYPKQVDAYNLFRERKIEVVADEDLFAHLNNGIVAGKRMLAASIQPNAIFFDARFRLIEPVTGSFGAPMHAPLLLNAQLSDDVDSDLIDELSEMMLGAKVISALDYAISVDGQDPEDAAEAWQRGRLLPR